MIYVQTEQGLTQVSPSLTKDKIIAALGYTPADNMSFFEDESGALVIGDEKGYAIARIDADGLTTTKISTNAITLNGEDLDAKLKSLKDAIDGIEIPEMPEIPEVDLSNYYNKTEVDNALKNVSVDLTGYAKEEDIPDVSLYDNHIADSKVHVSEEEKNIWNAKTSFSGNYADLSGAPNILDDNQDELVICDKVGNVIFRVDMNGLDVATILSKGKPIAIPSYSETDEGAVLKIVGGVPTWVVEA
jgi:hypothetical protein